MVKIWGKVFNGLGCKIPMKVEHVAKKGSASMLDAGEFLPFYAEKVYKFLRDKEKSFGQEWVQDVASRLYVLGKNNNGEVTNSSVDVGGVYCNILPRDTTNYREAT